MQTVTVLQERDPCLERLNFLARAKTVGPVVLFRIIHKKLTVHAVTPLSEDFADAALASVGSPVACTTLVIRA